MEREEGDRAFIGFPFGLALLLVMLIGMSCFLTCCLYWEKIRSLFQSDDNNDDQTEFARNEITLSPKPKQDRAQNMSLPVLMPGDQIPKFIALACPSKPSVLPEMEVHEPHSMLMSTIKLAHH
ncbi:hypothetical protein HS088_TW11G00184 [Tripterygium wilfordii]|uniref:Hydroxyproline-rich glycoprotein family protein n=1 Tax=Tripterygium wilfordii TaxID=458696 RepID=A0A7J7D1K8_TRIWF|nr:uncharacterized protein At5g65660-like [Tripterygium wilfordii]KAF5740119.1 hypothetical protein HS088_TW11G00184 [Tripterygium wilfordii]